MAVFSVYNYDTRSYDYYEGRGPGGTHAGSPPRARSSSSLGASPDQASWRLPIGAVKIGSGELPRGRIAIIGGGGGALGGIADDPVKLGVVAALGYLAWKVLR